MRLPLVQDHVVTVARPSFVFMIFHDAGDSVTSLIGQDATPEAAPTIAPVGL